jgi:hypothetical protein
VHKIFFVLIEVCGILQVAHNFLCYHFLFSRNSPAPINMKIPTAAIIVGPYGVSSGGGVGDGLGVGLGVGVGVGSGLCVGDGEGVGVGLGD